MGSLGSENGVLTRGGSTQGKVITCKAAVLWGPGEALVMEEVRVDPPQKMEVRVRILYTSVCHTDLSAWEGQSQAQRAFPRILGHEAAGIVESVGEGVEDLKEGDHVIPIFNGECGSCKKCTASGKSSTNLCDKFRVNPFKSVMSGDGKTRFSTSARTEEDDGRVRPVYHFLNTSTFTEYTVLDSACVVKLHPDAPLKNMTLLSCGLSTGVGAAWNTANVEGGSSVAIFGLGAVGLAVAEGARSRGAARIIGVDVNPDKFLIAKTMGVTDFINPKDYSNPVHEVIRGMTEGSGVDYSFECVGNSDVLREAFLSTTDGWGMTVILGIHAGPRMLPFHPMEFFDDFKGKSQLPALADKCMKGVLKLDGFITHELPFSEINRALELLKTGQSLRCLLHL
ncbi:hypothetical protein H6P81_006020 [Aristolochia fimbriata]|uniref:Alcohol dehydrogenase n=1 Tax=Aristolochia fimbriata TaxID=158543 RepID=A0AAV7EYZ3_ARIFI|nr:hypothetical protein H6P81_006020 [Aristolochia fimbriata]